MNDAADLVEKNLLSCQGSSTCFQITLMPLRHPISLPLLKDGDFLMNFKFVSSAISMKTLKEGKCLNRRRNGPIQSEKSNLVFQFPTLSSLNEMETS